MIKQKWQQFTMALGLWLLGGRETPREQDCAYEYGVIFTRFNNAIAERDEARKSSDLHYAKIKDLQVYLDASNEQYEILYKKYNRLKSRNKSLRDKLEPPVRRKAKKKRV